MDSRDVLRERLAGYESLCEIGVGRRPDLALALAERGVRVTATDVRDLRVPDPVRFVRDDVWAAADREDPGSAYRVDALYARNLPEELQRPASAVARRVGADLLFTTLGFEVPSIRVERASLAGGETLYVVR